ncbi:MAG: CehA/McbA family metallohydrolase [Gaiellaceae bacterium MAG52_C11]|nr:CehA/McbA family metallohydrolase [Candidatus Gaiellasilicea maunaloa]
MRIPPSGHFAPVNLAGHYNADRSTLPKALRTPADLTDLHGESAFAGIPFQLGRAKQPNVILLGDTPITIAVDSLRATYLVFVHVVPDRVTDYQPGFADYRVDGNELGDHAADYSLVYADGDQTTARILRRFAIQQSRIMWGASAFAAVPHARPRVFRTVNEALITAGTSSEADAIGGPSGIYGTGEPRAVYGIGETRVVSGRENVPEKLWLYALPNPSPEKLIAQILLTPRDEPAVIYAISATQLTDHPLRPQVRRKLRLTLPEGAQLNALGEFDDIAIDLGSVISARAALDYDAEAWHSPEPVVQPVRSSNAVLVEYAAHPGAKLYVGTRDGLVSYDLADASHAADALSVQPARRPVEIRIVEKDTKRPAPARLHLHGSSGEYLPPNGRHRKVNTYWFEDNYGEYANLDNQYAYVDGHCRVDLPLGTVFVEITRGHEVTPIRTSIEVTADTDTVTFELERVLRWREAGWVTADTHVHFLSPQTALLEGKAEGVNVVNLLASQWGEMYSNVSDFDGKTTFGAREFGGDGEFLVRVGTENRMQVLGHISLLGYRGEMIHPLCTGGPTESAVGDALEVTMAEWAQRCLDQGGLTVLPHAPNPQLERAADIVLALINAVEMMTFNPFNPAHPQINPYGIADWYRYLNLGYHVPLCAGSDKMAASSLLGGIRTYAHLGDREFTYEAWMDAMRAGNTFVTVGPLTELLVEGRPPGSRIQLPPTGGTVDVTWRVESVRLPIDEVEVVAGGLTVDSVTGGAASTASGSTRVKVTDSTWIALRVRGSYRAIEGELAAHTSAVQAIVGDKPLFANGDAMAVLRQIEGALAYVDTLAPRAAADRFRQMRATLEAAHNRLHQRLHNEGVFHRHMPLHGDLTPHEH